MEKKQEARKERRALQRADADDYSETVELGTVKKGDKPKKKTIQDINDVDTLAELKAASISRGKKQRISKKLAVL